MGGVPERRAALRIEGANENNLRDLTVALPPGMTALVGVSGSGKSSLAFDTLYHEARRRYLETLSLGSPSLRMPPARVRAIHGLGPAVAVAQNVLNRNPNSTVATAAGLHPYLRVLFARFAERRCPDCGAVVTRAALEDQLAVLRRLVDDGDRPVDVVAPLVRASKAATPGCSRGSRAAGIAPPSRSTARGGPARRSTPTGRTRSRCGSRPSTVTTTPGRSGDPRRRRGPGRHPGRPASRTARPVPVAREPLPGLRPAVRDPRAGGLPSRGQPPIDTYRLDGLSLGDMLALDVAAATARARRPSPARRRGRDRRPGHPPARSARGRSASATCRSTVRRRPSRAARRSGSGSRSSWRTRSRTCSTSSTSRRSGWTPSQVLGDPRPARAAPRAGR